MRFYPLFFRNLPGLSLYRFGNHHRNTARRALGIA
jgi:hypothetical protein